jgi:hypothetical protein
MKTDPRGHATHGRRWALWLLMFAGVVLHSSLCPPNAHAGVLGAMTRVCVSSAAGTPPPDPRAVEPVPDSGRAGDAGRPCAPAPRPHHHSPCGVMTPRGSSPQRSVAPWCDGAGFSPFVPPATYALVVAVPGGTRARTGPPRPPARPAGARLLIELCSART